MGVITHSCVQNRAITSGFLLLWKLVSEYDTGVYTNCICLVGLLSDGWLFSVAVEKGVSTTYIVMCSIKLNT